jgi:hypothetical protein
LAVAGLYKPQNMIFSVLFSAVFFLFPEGKEGFLNKIKTPLRLVIPCLIAWLGCYLYFASTARSQIFYDTVITFNRAYGGRMDTNLLQGLLSRNLLAPKYTWFLAPLVSLILVGFFLSFRQFTRPWGFLAAYLVSAYVSLALPGKFYPHYYQYWLPVLSVGGGWAIIIIGKCLKTFTSSLYLMPGILCLSLLVCYEGQNYLLSADNWSYKKFGSDFIKDKQLAKRLSRNLKPGESFVMLGYEPSLYFYSHISPPTGLVWPEYINRGPLAPVLLKRLLNDITVQKPDFLIFCFKDRKEYLTTVENLKPIMGKYHSFKYYPENGTFPYIVEKKVAAPLPEL